MAYSQKSFRTARGSAYALMACLLVSIPIMRHQHFDQIFLLSLVMVVGLIACWLMLYSHRYRDEIQRQAAERRTYWGYQLGLVACLPVLLLLLLPHTTLLDSLIQLGSGNHPVPRLYFWAGFMLPVVFQSLGVLALRLLAKLRAKEQA